VCDLLLERNLALGEHLHGVDTLGVLLAHLKDATKGAASDELKILKVVGSELLLGHALVGDLNANFAAVILHVFFVVSGGERVPLVAHHLVHQARLDFAHTEEAFILRVTVVDADVDGLGILGDIKGNLVLPYGVVVLACP